MNPKNIKENQIYVDELLHSPPITLRFLRRIGTHTLRFEIVHEHSAVNGLVRDYSLAAAVYLRPERERRGNP